jgi:Tfp pilus assembly protein PilN
MPAKTINLLTKVDFEKTPLGKFLRWSLTYGRYSIICTEIVVLLAFIYRFSLDRKITDLNDEIKQKSSIIEANQEFETEFRRLQSRIGEISALFTKSPDPVVYIKHLEQITPPGIQFTAFAMTGEEISISATSDTNSTLALFISQLKSSPLLTNVSITALSKRSAGSGAISFELDAALKSQTILPVALSTP